MRLTSGSAIGRSGWLTRLVTDWAPSIGSNQQYGWMSQARGNVAIAAKEKERGRALLSKPKWSIRARGV